jgi:hypothetical protein
MLKQTVNFKDYNDQDSEETLYFNLNKSEMADLLDLQPQLEEWARKTNGPERELDSNEIREFFDILKRLVDVSYGQRSADGKRFVKDDALLRDFKQSAAYDAFLFSLFEDPQNAVNFMTAILPKDLVAQAEVGQTADVVQLPSSETKDGEKKFSDYTQQELIEMPQEQFEALVGRDPKNMSKDALMIAFQRKNR